MHTDDEYWRALIRMGTTKLFMLRALVESPRHGYDLARRTADISEGLCSPTEGTIYPVLREWEQEGLVMGEWEVVSGRRRRVYEITQEGRAAYNSARGVWSRTARVVLELEAAPTGRLEDHLL